MKTAIVVGFMVVLACSSLADSPESEVSVRLRNVSVFRDNIVAKPDKINRLTAAVYQHPLAVLNIDRLEVPSERFKDVVAFFEGAEIDPEPDCSLPEIGTLQFDLKDNGVVRRICWYWRSSHKRLFFSSNGIRCQKHFQNLTKTENPALKLDALLRKIAAEAE